MAETTIQTYTLAFLWTVVLVGLAFGSIYFPIFDTYGITPNSDLNETQMTEFQNDIDLIAGDAEGALNNQSINDAEGNSLVAGWETGKKLSAMNRIRENLMRVMLRNGLLGWAPSEIIGGILATIIIIGIILYMSYFRGYKAH